MREREREGMREKAREREERGGEGIREKALEREVERDRDE